MESKDLRILTAEEVKETSNNILAALKKGLQKDVKHYYNHDMVHDYKVAKQNLVLVNLEIAKRSINK